MQKLSVKKLEEDLNPFENFILFGHCKPMTKLEIMVAVQEYDLLSSEEFLKKKSPLRREHIAYIAWLYAHGFGSALEVYTDSKGKMKVRTGQHLLLAAILRGDDSIRVKFI